MFCVIATDQDELSAVINACRVDDREPRLALVRSDVGMPRPACEPQDQG
jgi:hypothetical protein